MAPDRDPKETKIKVARSAKTGRFVPLSHAKKNPATTVVESVKKPSGSKSKGKKR